jgi:hypothetical protein
MEQISLGGREAINYRLLYYRRILPVAGSDVASSAAAFAWDPNNSMHK